jgi:phenylalanyl-tRNA synthetase beta chain
MNIKILDSWLREYLKTPATPKQIAEKLSLTSVSVERIENFKNDFVYDIEVTTNRADLMSVIGIAQEAATILPQSGIAATFVKPKFQLPHVNLKKDLQLTLTFDEKLVNRILAVIIEITIKESPQYVKDRLEASGIRSLNNVIDITNYVMREVGHPTHVFDYDRLENHTLNIRESKKNEKIKTLDEKEYTLTGGDIVADNGKGEIVDLISIMGTANSIVKNTTKRILLFIDNVEPTHLRKTSMELGIRTEAVILNEKGINPETASDALARGIELFQLLAGGKIISEIYDIYPKKPKETIITLSKEKINSVIGVVVPVQKSIDILTSLGFEVKSQGETFIVTVPAYKTGEDMQIPEDLIEEIARVYGYENIPDTLAPTATATYLHLGGNEFYWEDRIKDALKYWGFTEVYTYPMVSALLYEGSVASAIKIQNPLGDDMVYMRNTLTPSLIEVIEKNKNYENIKIFEVGNIYKKRNNELPEETLTLAGVFKDKKRIDEIFKEVKLVVVDLFEDLGIFDFTLQTQDDGIYLYLETKKNVWLGKIKIVNDNTIAFEVNLKILLQHATLKKAFKPISKYPPLVEDLALIAGTNVQTGDLIDEIKKQSNLIREVTLLDKYQETRTFHIIYQSNDKNLSDKEVGEIREKILKVLRDKFNAKLKD